MLKDVEPRITENTTDYTEHDFDPVPVLPPPIPQPEGWGPLSDVSHEDYVMIGSAVATLAEEEMPWEDRGLSALLFKPDPIRAEVASTSCCYDPEVFCDLLHKHIGLFTILTAVGSNTAVP